MSTRPEDSIAELKEKLQKYKFGDKLGISSFTDAEEDELKEFELRIGVFGPAGAGKSALINTVSKLLDKEEVAIQQSAGGEGTQNLDNFGFGGFTMFDTRGFFDIDSQLEETEFFRILYGSVRCGEVIDRGNYGKSKAKSAGIAAHKLNKPPLSRQLHAVLWVIRGDDIRLINEDYLDKLKFVQSKLRDEAITLITVITHSDIIDQSSDPIEARKHTKAKAREATKSYESNTFLIQNWTENVDTLDEDMTKQILKMIHTALESGERSVKMRQTKRKQAERQSEKEEQRRNQQSQASAPSSKKSGSFEDKNYNYNYNNL